MGAKNHAIEVTPLLGDIEHENAPLDCPLIGWTMMFWGCTLKSYIVGVSVEGSEGERRGGRDGEREGGGRGGRREKRMKGEREDR